MERYAGSRSWETYRAILAAEFGIVIGTEPEEREEIIRGHRLHIDDWPAQGALRGRVILVHGGGGHGRALAPFAWILASRGWRVLAPDLPGYGLSVPAPGFAADYGEWPATVAALADAQDTPVALMGLSVGGLTALYAAQDAQAVSAVVATTLLDLSRPDLFVKAARWPLLGLVSLWSLRLVPWIFDRVALPLKFATPLKAMSANAAMARYFVSDPLLGGRRVPSRFFRTLHAYERACFDLSCPLLLAHPGADAWTPTALSRPVFDAVTSPKAFLELTNGSHLVLEEPALTQLQEATLSFLEEHAAFGDGAGR